MHPGLKLIFLLGMASLLVLAPDAWMGAAAAAVALLLLLLPRPMRRALAAFATSSWLAAGLTYGVWGPHDATVQLGPLGLSGLDVQTGLATATRLCLLLALFLLGARWLQPRDLLPFVPRRGLPAYVAGSLLRLVPTLQAEAARLRDAQAARGHRFRAGPTGAASWRPLLVPLFVATLRRAREQAFALHLAGLAPDPPGERQPGRRAHRWAIVVALAALAVAGRLLLVAVPGVSLSFFVLFVAGVAYGPRVGFLVGLLERVATDLLLSGLNPVWIPMAPVDAILGAAAGLLGRTIDFGQRRNPHALATAVAAGAAGGLMTLLFSVAADTSTWAFYRFLLPAGGAAGAHALWIVLVARGLVFNVPSFLFNTALFAVAARAVLRALAATTPASLATSAPLRHRGLHLPPSDVVGPPPPQAMVHPLPTRAGVGDARAAPQSSRGERQARKTNESPRGNWN